MTWSLQLLSLAVVAVLQCRTVQACRSGHYLEAGNCVACPKGHFCPNNAPPIPCPPGTISYSSVSNRVGCARCPPGYYQDKSGQDYWKPCPDGYQCRNSAVAPVLCPPGTVGYSRVSDRVNCWVCTSGSYQDKSGQMECIGCPVGHFCPRLPESRPSACPTGYTNYQYVNDRATCSRCGIGYYQDRNGQGTCMPCPVGHYCPQFLDSKHIPCPTGTISYIYVNDRINCVTCPAGHYQDKVGQANCLPCPTGHYCPKPEMPPQACPPGYISREYTSDRTSCTRCGSGYFQDKSGQQNCIGCPQGHYCPRPESRPLPCPLGFKSANYISDRLSCQECSPGQCTTPVQPIVPCNPGSVASDTSTCALCPLGRYQDQSGQTVCKVCPNGHYCLTSSVAPVQCPSGSYSTTYMTDRTKCLPCPTGEYQHQAGQTGCLTCPNGHHCPKAADPPIRCPVGTYSTIEMQDRLVCAECPKGSYQDETGQWQCKTCPAGHLCPKPDISPVQCPPGTYSTTSTLIRTACLPCPAGTYQDQCGQSMCKACPSEHCPNLWAATTCPSLESINQMPAACNSNSPCPSLREIGNDSIACKGPLAQNRYSGQPVQSVLGNNNVSLQVVQILPEHRTATNINDTTITMSTAQAFDRMATAASLAGVNIRIESGFRSYAHQVELLECWKAGKCIHKAAEPGKSKHGAGVALDLNTQCGAQDGDRAPRLCASSAVYNWLLSNAHKFGFTRTVRKEPHHWEYVGGSLDGPVDFAKLE